MLRAEEKIGYQFRNSALLEQALTHSSYSNEHGTGHAGCYERLEFLGDSILGFVTAEFLYQTYPQLPEGELTHIRAELVCENNLARVAASLGLGEEMRFGNGEKQNGGSIRASIIADSVESVIAAIFLDGGFERAKQFILQNILSNAQDYSSLSDDYKTQLQEYVQTDKNAVLHYVLEDATGPDHCKSFVMAVYLNDRRLAAGSGTSKKRAEQAAAKAGLEFLNDYAENSSR